MQIRGSPEKKDGMAGAFSFAGTLLMAANAACFQGPAAFPAPVSGRGVVFFSGHPGLLSFLFSRVPISGGVKPEVAFFLVLQSGEVV